VARQLKYASSSAAILDSGLVSVPNLIGRTLQDVLSTIARSLLTLVNSGRDGVVVEQDPAPGTEVSPGTAITVRFGEDPGDAGVREPRRPIPPLRHNTAAAEPGD
jgi:hypothetical protein